MALVFNVSMKFRQQDIHIDYLKPWASQLKHGFTHSNAVRSN